ncbi:hypothetical protein ACGFYU_31175 [Streptomyces sp. NPDC048337]|uniref:hypothetical protein n=1 Tax=Streptomyces sp. NPDC048337 TaxID=3365535 RepID=UPI0037246B39
MTTAAAAGFVVVQPAHLSSRTRVGAAAGAAHSSAYDPAHAYSFGLQRVLDAFAALIGRIGDAKASTSPHRHDVIAP